jgi:hypothetical protein
MQPIQDVPIPILDLDVAENIPINFSLPAILSLFQSDRLFQDVIELLPYTLRDFAVDIVIFLLR